MLRHTAAMGCCSPRRHHHDRAVARARASDHDHAVYLHADLALKQRAIDRTTPPGTKPGRYRPADPLLAFLENL